MTLFQELIKIFIDIDDPDEMASFFQEIFTPNEIEDISLRWQLLKELHGGQTQRSIAAKYGMSLCKITRGSKVLKREDSIAKKILDTIKETK